MAEDALSDVLKTVRLTGAAYFDVVAQEPLPPDIDVAKLNQAVNVAFTPAEGLTAAFVVTWKGRPIAERYADKTGRARVRSTHSRWGVYI